MTARDRPLQSSQLWNNLKLQPALENTSAKFDDQPAQIECSQNRGADGEIPPTRIPAASLAEARFAFCTVCWLRALAGYQSRQMRLPVVSLNRRRSRYRRMA
jgi:hypothetical protein